MKRLTREGLRRLVRNEARRLQEGPGPMRSQTRGRRHGEGSAAANARHDPTAAREDRIDDLSHDPRMIELHAGAKELMADGYTIDDVIAALIVLEDPDPSRSL